MFSHSHSFSFSDVLSRQARKDASTRGIKNCRFVVADAAKLTECEELKQYDGFDWVTAFDAVHDQTRPLDCLKGLSFVLTAASIASDSVNVLQQ